VQDLPRSRPVRDPGCVDLALSEHEIEVRVQLPDGRFAADTWLHVSNYGKVRTDGRGVVKLLSPPPARIVVTTTDRRP